MPQKPPDLDDRGNPVAVSFASNSAGKPPDLDERHQPVEPSYEDIMAGAKDTLKRVSSEIPSQFQMDTSEPEPSLLQTGLKLATSPLTEAPSRWAKKASEYINPESTTAGIRGIGSAYIEGLGNAVSGLTSPLNIAMFGLGGAAGVAGRAGLPAIAKAASMGEKGLSAAMVPEGAYHIATAKHPDEALSGLLEAGMGAYGAFGHPAGRVADIADEAAKPPDVSAPAVVADLRSRLDAQTKIEPTPIKDDSGRIVAYVDRSNVPPKPPEPITDASGRVIAPSQENIIPERPEGPWESNAPPSEQPTIKPKPTEEAVYDIARQKHQMGLEPPSEGEPFDWSTVVKTPHKAEAELTAPTEAGIPRFGSKRTPIPDEQLARQKAQSEKFAQTQQDIESQVNEAVKPQDMPDSSQWVDSPFKEALKDAPDIRKDLQTGNFRIRPVVPTERMLGTQKTLRSNPTDMPDSLLQQKIDRNDIITRANKNDYSGPPIVSFTPDGNVYIHEGHTRFAKALETGQKVNSVIVDQRPASAQKSATRVSRAEAPSTKPAGFNEWLNNLGKGESGEGKVPDRLMELFAKSKTTKLTPEEISEARGLADKTKTAPEEKVTKRLLFKSELSPNVEIRGRKPYIQKPPNALSQVWDASRSLQSVDLPGVTSAALRQSRPLIFSADWFKAWGSATRAFGSQKALDMIDAKILSNKYFQPRYEEVMNRDGGLLRYIEKPSIAEEYGVKMTDLLNRREEAIVSSLAEKIPGYGRYVKASNRAYTGFLNDLRAAKFEQLMDAAEASGQGHKTNPMLARKIADYVNNATGRGSLEYFGGKINLESMATVLGHGMYSPRALSARLAFMNPTNYLTAPKLVRNEYWKSLARMGIGWGAMTGLGSLIPGAHVSFDPNNSDFGKIRIGDTRIDPGAGFLQLLVLMHRELPQSLGGGGTTSSTGLPGYPGKFTAFGKGRNPTTRGGLLENYLYNQLHPSARYVWDMLTATQAKPFDLTDRSLQMILPFYVNDIADAAKSDNKVLTFFAPLLSSIGTGIQAYEKGGFGKPQLTPAIKNLTGVDLPTKQIGR